MADLRRISYGSRSGSRPRFDGRGRARRHRFFHKKDKRRQHSFHHRTERSCVMSETAADSLVKTLIEWGVEIIFGLPGDGINGIMESLRTHQEQLKFLQVRHEEAAAFMACAYAKYTEKLGVCLATSGPGGIHLLNGLYDAKLDGQPVLAITGMHYHDLIGTLAQQDVELDHLFMEQL